MDKRDSVCTLLPYFKVHAGKMDAFRDLCKRFTARTQSEPGCLHYVFSFDGDVVHCREAYWGADGVFAHVSNVKDLLAEAMTLAELPRVECHGTSEELEKLRGPMAEGGLKPQFFVVESGFYR